MSANVASEPGRTHPRHGPVVPTIATAPVDALPGVARTSFVVPVLRYAVLVLLCVGMFLFIACLAIWGVFRWRCAPGTWPTPQDVGLSVTWLRREQLR